MPLKGRTVLLTGAAAGIGRAIAERAAQSGARLMLGDIDAATLEKTADALKRQGAHAEWRVCDVRSLAQVEALVAACQTAYGDPDTVFANAGIEGRLGAPWDPTDEEFSGVINVNLIGVWRTMKAVLPLMVKRGAGSIVATSSAAGLVGADGLAAYVASKHGVVGLVRSAAISVAKAGVRVNALCPGMVDTALLRRLSAAEPALEEKLLSLKPMGRFGDLKEIAAAAVWLASDEASYVTGHALSVDGGYVAQ